jgi:hypothetical protein
MDESSSSETSVTIYQYAIHHVVEHLNNLAKNFKFVLDSITADNFRIFSKNLLINILLHLALKLQRLRKINSTSSLQSDIVHIYKYRIFPGYVIRLMFSGRKPRTCLKVLQRFRD